MRTPKPLPYAAYSGTEEYFNKMKWGGFKVSELEVKGPYNLDEFCLQYKAVLQRFQDEIFTALMRVEWADRKILFKGKHVRSDPDRSPGRDFNTAVKFFYEQFLGFSRKTWSDGFFFEVRSFAEDLFPGFEELDGFKEPFKFPYQYMTLECLCFVSKLEFRMDLLAEGERMHLTIPKFYDYVAAYLTDINYRTGREWLVYYRVWNNDRIPYVNEKVGFAERLKRKDAKRKEKVL